MMATETKKDEVKAFRKLYRLNVEQFLASIKIGVFPHGPRLELLAGLLVAQLSRTDPHDFVVGAVGEELRKIVPSGWFVREEKAVTLGRFSRPIPDLAVVKAPRALYVQRAPTELETALIVEVGESNYRLDRGLKWRLYASAGIPCYWIINLHEPQIEVYRNPEGKGRSASYRDCSTFRPGDEVPLFVDGQDVGRVPFCEILL
jgi:Uma2 family endonuclease